MSLLDDIEAEIEIDGRRAYVCSACEAVRSTKDEETKQALADAFAGKLNLRAAMRVSQKYGLGVGHQGLLRHRREGHQPA